MSYNYYVYILTNNSNRVMYIGVTSNLKRRIFEHKNGVHDGFTKKYNVYKLVYYEHYTDVWSAIRREKILKGWKRERKNRLVDECNPNWKDFSEVLFQSFKEK